MVRLQAASIAARGAGISLCEAPIPERVTHYNVGSARKRIALDPGLRPPCEGPLALLRSCVGIPGGGTMSKVGA